MHCAKVTTSSSYSGITCIQAREHGRFSYPVFLRPAAIHGRVLAGDGSPIGPQILSNKPDLESAHFLLLQWAAPHSARAYNRLQNETCLSRVEERKRILLIEHVPMTALKDAATMKTEVHWSGAKFQVPRGRTGVNR